MLSFFHNRGGADSVTEQEVLLKIRSRGKQRYVWVTGMLWGAFMFVLTNATSVFVRHKKLDWWFLPISLVIWLTAGYGFGVWMWRSLGKKFNAMAK